MSEKSIDLANEPLARKQHFIKLGIQQLVRAGGIATLQSEYLRRMLAAMKLDADFTILPGQTTIYMREDVSPSQGQTVMTFKTGLGYNFDRLEDVEGLLNDGMEGKFYGGLEEALTGLERLARRPNYWGLWVHPVGWSIIGFLTTILLRGRFLDGAVASVTGLIFGLALISLEVAPQLAPTFDFWISFIIAFILALVQEFVVKSLYFWPTFLSSVILILPGFSMSMGFTDIFTRNSAFGLVTLFNATWTALSIGVGAFLGVRSASALTLRTILPALPSTLVAPGYPNWVYMLIYPFFNFLLSVTFQAKPIQAAIIAPLALAPFGLYTLCGCRGVSEEASVLSSVIFMGIIGHIYGRVTRSTEIPTIFSGIIVFAPGTYAARFFYYGLDAAWNSKDKALTAPYAFTQGGLMLTIAASIAIGLLLSRALFGRT